MTGRTGYIGTIQLSVAQEITKFTSFLVFVLFSVTRPQESCHTVNKQWRAEATILQNYTTLDKPQQLVLSEGHSTLLKFRIFNHLKVIFCFDFLLTSCFQTKLV